MEVKILHIKFNLFTVFKGIDANGINVCKDIIQEYLKMLIQINFFHSSLLLLKSPARHFFEIFQALIFKKKSHFSIFFTSFSFGNKNFLISRPLNNKKFQHNANSDAIILILQIKNAHNSYRIFYSLFLLLFLLILRIAKGDLFFIDKLRM